MSNLAAFLSGGPAPARVVHEFNIPSLPDIPLYCRALLLSEGASLFADDLKGDSIAFAIRLAALCVCDKDGKPLRSEREWRDNLTFADQSALQEVCDAVMPLVGFPKPGQSPAEMGNESTPTETGA